MEKVTNAVAFVFWPIIALLWLLISPVCNSTNRGKVARVSVGGAISLSLGLAYFCRVGGAGGAIVLTIGVLAYLFLGWQVSWLIEKAESDLISSGYYTSSKQ